MGDEEAIMERQLPGTTMDEEIKRTSRVLQMLLLIASSPARFSRRELAARFEIGERMVTKDLAILRHGLRLDLRHSPEGYYFEKTPHLPALQYSFGEALALLTAVQAAQGGPGGGMTSSPDLAAAVARLEALFPPEFLPLLRRAAEGRGGQEESEHAHHRQHMLNYLLRALVNLQKVEILYETASRGGEITQRVVRPYAVMPYERSWQLVAYCEWRQQVLMFKVDRIQQARLLGVEYSIPAGFSLEAYMGNTWGVLRQPQGPEEEVQLLFDAVAGRWVAEGDWHPTQRVEHLEDGRVLFGVRVVVTPEFVKWVLQYGQKVKVLEPAHLAVQVRAEHLAAAGQY
jgi:predicted DNA-binding transcriptional regulator YafY